MSFWFYDADIPSNFTAAGGVAGLGEIYHAATEQARKVDNTDASARALASAYDQRISAIKAATGQAIENPLRAASADVYANVGRINPALATPQPAEWAIDGPAQPSAREREEQKFSAWLQQMQQQFPQYKDIIRADVPIEKDAEAIANRSDADLGRLNASRPGIGGLVASFAGGFRGSLEDPVTLATLFAGGGPGVGRTVMARIANVALKEALINGGVEAALQPTVQAWREKAGLPHGFEEGLKNTLFAAAAGALFGGGVEAIGAAGRRVLTGQWLDRAAEETAKSAPLRVDIKRALAGDADAALEAIRPIRDALSPEARAAVDLHETMAAQRDALPEVSSPALHQANLDAAQKAVVDPMQVFEPQIDRQKIERIVRDLVPDAPIRRKAEETSLQGFLIRAGGLQDQKGEITALGLQNAGERFKGRLVRDTGRALDDARELAAEAGYFNHKFGTAAEAVEKSTIGDLLDELDAESRRPVDAAPDDNGRSYVEQRVTDLLRQTGPEVDEKLISRAVQLAEAEKIDPLEAFDRVAAEDDASREITAPAPIERRDDPMLPEGTISEPEFPAEEELFTPDDLAELRDIMDIPFFEDGRAATGQDIIDDLEELHGLFQLTEACKA